MDVVEAWVVLGAWVFAVAGGLLAGLGVTGAVERSLDRRRAERRAVSAVLIEDAADRKSAQAVDDERVWGTVRWRAPDGAVRTGQARVSAESPAGTRVTVWTDRHGGLTSEPVTHQEAQAQAAMVGVVTAMGVGGIVLGGAWAVRGCLDRRRMARWDEEWARIDTPWGRKTG
ncbi:hypothetical protein WB401_12950 [Streptomyces brasiliscabiei]|uniref:Integral membrane protein n=1 Tax=Streptomyces brasiliscabiei TaxID=2736302 RepID=A0ABU8GL49_9ACTN